MAAMASEQGNILVAGRYCGVQRIWSTTIINGIAVLKVFCTHGAMYVLYNVACPGLHHHAIKMHVRTYKYVHIYREFIVLHVYIYIYRISSTYYVYTIIIDILYTPCCVHLYSSIIHAKCFAHTYVHVQWICTKRVFYICECQ